MRTPDQSAMVLSNQIRDLIGKHMTNYTATEFAEMVSVAVMALYVEVARLKHLAIKSKFVTSDAFDSVFLKGYNKHYEQNKDRDEQAKNNLT